MKNRRLFKLGRNAALLGVCTMSWMGPLTMTLQAYADGDPIHIDSDDPRYELGYDHYRLTELEDGRYHVEVTGLGDHWGDIIIDSDWETWMTFDVIMAPEFAHVAVDLVEDFDHPFAVVRIDDDVSALAMGDGEGAFEYILVTDNYVPADSFQPLRMLTDLMADFNFRSEFGEAQQTSGDGDFPSIVALYGLIDPPGDDPEEPVFDPEFYQWWHSFWGMPYDSSMVMVKEESNVSGVWDVHLKTYDPENDDLVTIATAALQKHHLFSIPEYVSDVYDVEFFGVDPMSPTYVEYTYPGTIQFSTEYWAVTFHGDGNQIAPAVISLTRFNIEKQGLPPYDGGKTASVIFPTLEFESESALFDFLELESTLDNADSTTLSGEDCYPPDNPTMCAIWCTELNQCLMSKRHERDLALAQCSLNFDDWFGGIWNGVQTGVAIGIAVGGGAGSLVKAPWLGAGVGAISGVKFGFLGGSMVGGAHMWANYFQCKRTAWRVYRTAICQCFEQQTEECGSGFVPTPPWCQGS